MASIDAILTQESKCPICGVHNIPWCDIEDLMTLTGIKVPSCDVRGATYEYDGRKFTCGTGCWDSMFGDECGSCLNTVANAETSMSGFCGFEHFSSNLELMQV